MDYHLTYQSSPRMVKFRHYASQLLQLSEKDADVAAERMATQFAELVKNRVVKCPGVPGADSFLKTFVRRLPLYVSSNTPQQELIDIIRSRGLDGYFKRIFGNPPTSKQGAIQYVLQTEGISPDQCILIGDAMSDYQAAIDMGLNFIGRDSGLPLETIAAPIFKDLFEARQALLNMLTA